LGVGGWGLGVGGWGLGVGGRAPDENEITEESAENGALALHAHLLLLASVAVVVVVLLLVSHITTTTSTTTTTTITITAPFQKKRAGKRAPKTPREPTRTHTAQYQTRTVRGGGGWGGEWGEDGAGLIRKRAGKMREKCVAGAHLGYLHGGQQLAPPGAAVEEGYGKVEVHT